MQLQKKYDVNGKLEEELSLDLTVRELVNLRLCLRKYIVSEQLMLESARKNLSTLLEHQTTTEEIEHANALVKFHIENIEEIQTMLDDLQR